MTVILAVAATTARADALLEYQSGGSQGMERMLIKNGQLRVDTGGGDWLLFRSGEESLTFIDSSKKTYTVFDQTTVDKLGGTIDAARAEMEKALAQLPPGQREKMRSMMQGAMNSMLGGEENMSIEVHATGATDTVSGVDCRMMEARRGSKLFAQVCIADAADLDIAAGDARVFSDWAGYTQKMMEQLAAKTQGLFPFHAPRFGPISGGLPILNVDEDGSRTQLRQHSTDALDTALFQIPDDYQRESLDIDF